MSKTSGADTCTATGSDATVYTPHGVRIPLASNLLTGGEWEAALLIMTEQQGINRLVITILPLLTVVEPSGCFTTGIRAGRWASRTNRHPGNNTYPILIKEATASWPT